MGLEGRAESLLGLTTVSYVARTESAPIRTRKAHSLSIAEEAMAKREINHELTYYR